VLVQFGHDVGLHYRNCSGPGADGSSGKYFDGTVSGPFGPCGELLHRGAKRMSILNALIGPVTGLLDSVITDKDERARLAHEIATMSEKHAQQALLGQLEINKAEAASGSLFKGGWRPMVGWIAALSFGYTYLLYPIIGAFYGHYFEFNFDEIAPKLDDGPMLTVLAGMLGIGTLRTYEKQKGLTK